MTRYGSRTSRDCSYPKDGLWGILEADGVFAGPKSRLQQGLVEISGDLYCRAVGLVRNLGLVCKTVWDSLGCILEDFSMPSYDGPSDAHCLAKNLAGAQDFLQLCLLLV